LRPGSRQPPGSHLSRGINRAAGDLEVLKRCWGAFTGTDFERRLRDAGITTLWLAGVSTSHGVESSGRTASDLGCETFFVEDTMSAFASEDHMHSIVRVFPLLGPVVTHDELLT
jgi:nicotinamidase-related amidase